MRNISASLTEKQILDSIERIRRDKPAAEADRLETLMNTIEKRAVVASA